MSVLLIGCLYSSLKVTKIVQTVKDTDDINSVCDRLLYEILYYVICIMVVTKNVLTTEKHLQLCILEACSEFTESLPWILLQETKGGIKCSSTPALYCMVSDLIHLINDRKHLLCCHSGGDQRLMSITQNGFGYF